MNQFSISNVHFAICNPSSGRSDGKNQLFYQVSLSPSPPLPLSHSLDPIA